MVGTLVYGAGATRLAPTRDVLATGGKSTGLSLVQGETLSPGWISTWTPKVCKIMALMAVIMGFGLLFYILLGV